MRPRDLRRWALVALTAVGALCLFAPPTSATIEEQRARLPPPATCQDPVEGIWLGKRYEMGEWMEFSLEIHRKKPDAPELVGVMKNHWWRGPPSQPQPPPCAYGDHLVTMPSTGKVFPDLKLRFDGGPWKNDPAACTPYRGGYNPDHFTGKIDPAIQEFLSVNNDGGTAVNEPVVFRRVKCFDGPLPEEVAGPQRDAKPRIDIKPPNLLPLSRPSGCSK